MLDLSTQADQKDGQKWDSPRTVYSEKRYNLTFKDSTKEEIINMIDQNQTDVTNCFVTVEDDMYKKKNKTSTYRSKPLPPQSNGKNEKAKKVKTDKRVKTRAAQQH